MDAAESGQNHRLGSPILVIVASKTGGRIMRERAIRYDVVGCSLGTLLVAATDRGICRVRFGEPLENLAAALEEELPFAVLRRDRVGLKPWCDALVACVDGHRTTLDLPMDVSGSRFQTRVWDALRRIPRGETRTYGEVARAVQRPRAARAVARACASNPVAVVVPCHRVVASDGTLGGYRWGTERKRLLLEREGPRDGSI
jgi:AraC family transcriptional regulator of adaptative response/methylated-DNA-[protein]-cysteine methyltransferase